jgi:pimeloyl-ACP methyl ester carboxylesterase
VYRDRVVPWRAAPEARAILERAEVGLVPAPERTRLTAALASSDPAGLPSDALSVDRLLTNHDPRRVAALTAALPARVRAAIAAFSPSTHLRALRAPLFVLQSVHDPATPPTEGDRLRDDVPRARLVVLRTFEHVTPPRHDASVPGEVADLFGAWEFVSWILAAQE